MPDQALVVIPHPMGGISAEAVRGKVKRVFPDLLRQLTDWTPGDTAAQQSQVLRYVRFSGSVSELHAEFYARGWCAGLPFVPPTRELVESLLRGTSHPADEVVWDGVPPRMGILTVELVAACAAMAGCTARAHAAAAGNRRGAAGPGARGTPTRRRPPAPKA